jgi:RNA polymerase subunit RPABC4/transcription elongation factor Spt4
MIALTPDEQVLMVDDAKYHGTKGRLYLTNKRMEFEYEKRGIVFKGKYTGVTIPLERILGVAVIGVGPFKKLSLNLTREPGQAGLSRYEFNTGSAESWKAKIETAKALPRRQEVLMKETREVVREVVKTKCYQCGMLVDPNLSVCPNCGSLLTTRETKEVLVCPYCRSRNEPTAKFCSNCGSSLG